MLEDMELENQNSLPTNHGEEEANSRRVFHYFFMFIKVIRILGVFLKLYTCKFLYRNHWDVISVNFCNLGIFMLVII